MWGVAITLYCYNDWCLFFPIAYSLITLVMKELSHYLQLLAIGLTSSTWSKSIVYVVSCVIVYVAMGMMVAITLGGLLT